MKQRKSWPLRVVSQLLLLCLLVTTALVGSQPGGTAQPGTVDQLPDPLTMSRISLGLMGMYLNNYSSNPNSPKPDYPDYFAGFYDCADGTMVMCLTDTSEAVLNEVREAFYNGTNAEYLDEWLPTITFQEVKYSSNQLKSLYKTLRKALAEADCGEFRTELDNESNRVVAFCETDEGLALAATYAQPEDILLVRPMEDYEAWWTYATRNTIRFSESAAAERPEEPESAAAAGAQPGGTAQPGTVDQLPDPLTMSRISLGLEIAFMDYYRGESLPDFFGGFYYNADGTAVMCLTDTSEAVLEEIRTAFYSYHDGRNPEHFDKWLPTVQITEVKYSFVQLVEVDRALRSALAEADCGEYITQIDFESNRVVAFCETDEGLALAATYAQPEDILLVQPMEDYEAWWTYATRNTIRFSESAAAEQPEEPESAAAAGLQPGGTAQSGTVRELPDPLTMSRISLGLEIAFMDYYRGESLPDFFGGFYDNSNQGGEAQTIYNIITDVEFSDDFSFDALCLY